VIAIAKIDSLLNFFKITSIVYHNENGSMDDELHRDYADQKNGQNTNRDPIHFIGRVLNKGICCPYIRYISLTLIQFLCNFHKTTLGRYQNEKDTQKNGQHFGYPLHENNQRKKKIPFNLWKKLLTMVNQYFFCWKRNICSI